MRIIAGKYRGRRLNSVPGEKSRPTADRTREALFSILGESVVCGRVLDLFAGTGALGLEALSRGAKKAVLVENDPAAGEVIGKNIGALKTEGSAELILGDCKAALESLAGRGEVFDLVLADPPYRGRVGENLLVDIERFAILIQDGIVVIEHPLENLPFVPETGWRLLERKKYGRAVLSFYGRGGI